MDGEKIESSVLERVILLNRALKALADCQTATSAQRNWIKENPKETALGCVTLGWTLMLANVRFF